MRKYFLLLIVALLTLAACGNKEEEVHFLEVEFEVPEHIEVGETLELKAIVSYGGELVKDADEVKFEVWEKNDRENAVFYDGINNKDGSYTYEVTFDKDGIFEMYAHTTARDQHTMPLREIVVGEGGDYDDEEESGFHTEGFDMHFMEVESAKAGEEVSLVVHVMLEEEHLADAKVRYEIWQSDSEERDWVDADEEGHEYKASYTFTEAGTYEIQIHVEKDELHEHAIYTIDVEE